MLFKKHIQMKLCITSISEGSLWYYRYMSQKSKTIISILSLIIIVLGLILIKVLYKPSAVSIPTKTTSTEETKATPLSITKEKLTEENFTGTRPRISGKSFLADTARSYIDQTIADFRTQANTDVPAMRVQFGADAPTATYSIDIDAAYTHSHRTESIIISQYLYTGGANGNSSYKVFTVKDGGTTLATLGDVVKDIQKNAFTNYVIQKLLKYTPEGTEGPVVFEEEVKALKFDSFRNWSYDANNIIIYFDKYEVGPGALGSLAFPLPLSKINGYLISTE